MASKNDENFIAFCNELRTYVKEHHLFPKKHCRMSHKIKYTRKKIKAGTLEDWKCEMFEDIDKSRDLTIHTGGGRGMSHDSAYHERQEIGSTTGLCSDSLGLNPKLEFTNKL